jgi:hypothetical protein
VQSLGPREDSHEATNVFVGGWIGPDLGLWRATSAGDDRLAGGDGNDQLLGGVGSDRLDDCVGSNTFDGGADSNVCRGTTVSSSFASCQSALHCGPSFGGGGPSQLLAQTPTPTAELALTDTDVYFRNQAAIDRVSTTGGAAATFVDAGALDVSIDQGLDIGDGFLYWSSSGPTDSLFRLPLSGGTSGVFSTGSPTHRMLYPQVSAGFVYDSSLPINHVERTFASGSSAPTVVAVGTTNFAPVPLHRNYIATCDRLFFEDLQGGLIPIKSTPPGGGPITTLVASAGAFLRGLDVDGSNLYFADFTSIKSVPLGGGAVTALATDPGRTINQIVVGSNNVYWLSQLLGTTGACVDLSIKSVPKAGGPTSFLEDLPGLCGNDLAHDETSLFWTDTTALGTGEVRRLGI